MNIYSDAIKGYGDTRFIGVFFQLFNTKNGKAPVYSTRKSIEVLLSSGVKGRLSTFTPGTATTQVQAVKDIVTVWLDDVTPEEHSEYQSDSMCIQYFDRETQRLITPDEMNVLLEADESITVHHYA